MKWVGLVLAALLAAGAYVFFGVLPGRFDAKTNVVLPHGAYKVSAAARALHKTIPIADLHADTLLWKRDPAKRQSRGQTDLVRLREGGVALQVFTAVTKVPKNMNLDENAADSDQLTLLMAAQAWPPRTWFSIYERAAYQAGRLAKLEKDAPDRFIFVRSSADLQRALDEDKLAGIYGIEGAHPLEGDLANIARLYDQGVRVMGLQHFFDNELGGSLHGQSGAGLTEFGEQAVDAAVAQGVVIDLAHASEAVVRDVLARSSKPVIVSHTGLKGHCDTARNIPDDLMKAIADHGGLVGVGYWEAAACATSPEGIAAEILYGVGLLGADHVALGSDFDGAVTTALDASELAAITQALMDAGLDNETIRAVMGENAVRFFLENLPAQ
ncbi:dipeptidase [Hyphococcus luteus]|uniref:Peptidase M19 n=1 Tax=Hyphococcus luteus TaxID=2058213 RepID=A0A2S7K5E9_9PROT|nr:dipeptidase [Marinicaulis flavus]PQA87730.1 peptidase M19 [Marinicaulis flavus]